jgi:hypothetical protein
MERMQLQAERFELGGTWESNEEMAAIIRLSSFRGARSSREPGIQKLYAAAGFRSAPSKSAVADLDNDIAELG